MVDLSALVRRVAELAASVSLMPVFRWGVVSGLAPLEVQFDAADAPMAGVPDTLVSGLRVGERVLVLLYLRRATIVGRGKGGMVGEVIMYAGADLPSGYLRCDGAAVSRTAYSRLFAVIGTTYGAGNGSSTFNLPDFRGRGPMGHHPGDGIFGIVGAAGGARTHTLTVSEMPAHKHTLTYYGSIGGTTYQGVQGPNTSVVGGDSRAVGNTGGGDAHNNLQPYMTVPFLIRA